MDVYDDEFYLRKFAIFNPTISTGEETPEENALYYCAYPNTTTVGGANSSGSASPSTTARSLPSERGLLSPSPRASPSPRNNNNPTYQRGGTSPPHRNLHAACDTADRVQTDASCFLSTLDEMNNFVGMCTAFSCLQERFSADEEVQVVDCTSGFLVLFRAEKDFWFGAQIGTRSDIAAATSNAMRMSQMTSQDHAAQEEAAKAVSAAAALSPTPKAGVGGRAHAARHHALDSAVVQRFVRSVMEIKYRHLVNSVGRLSPLLQTFHLEARNIRGFAPDQQLKRREMESVAFQAAEALRPILVPFGRQAVAMISSYLSLGVPSSLMLHDDQHIVPLDPAGFSTVCSTAARVMFVHPSVIHDVILLYKGYVAFTSMPHRGTCDVIRMVKEVNSKQPSSAASPGRGHVGVPFLPYFHIKVGEAGGGKKRGGELRQEERAIIWTAHNDISAIVVCDRQFVSVPELKNALLLSVKAELASSLTSTLAKAVALLQGHENPLDEYIYLYGNRATQLRKSSLATKMSASAVSSATSAAAASTGSRGGGGGASSGGASAPQTVAIVPGNGLPNPKDVRWAAALDGLRLAPDGSSARPSAARALLLSRRQHSQNRNAQQHVFAASALTNASFSSTQALQLLLTGGSSSTDTADGSSWGHEDEPAATDGVASTLLLLNDAGDWVFLRSGDWRDFGVVIPSPQTVVVDKKQTVALTLRQAEERAQRYMKFTFGGGAVV